MKEKNPRLTEIKMSGATWYTCFGCGDLVWVYPYSLERGEKFLGMVTEAPHVNQELMFPFIPVYVFENKKIIEYQINSLEIVSKT